MTEWTILGGAETPAVALSARDLAVAIGLLDLDLLREHHIELTLAVAELAQSADHRWPWGADDATVTLLRALAKLALVAPDATSVHAAQLARDLGASDQLGTGPK